MCARIGVTEHGSPIKQTVGFALAVFLLFSASTWLLSDDFGKVGYAPASGMSEVIRLNRDLLSGIPRRERIDGHRFMLGIPRN